MQCSRNKHLRDKHDGVKPDLLFRCPRGTLAFRTKEEREEHVQEHVQEQACETRNQQPMVRV